MTGPGQPVRVVAEFGQTNLGSVEAAVAQARAAATAGCWAAKWQLLTPNRLAAPDAAAYWAHARAGELQAETFTKNGLLDYGAWAEVRAECRLADIEFLATPFDLEALAALDKLDVTAIKIASGDITYHDLLRAAGNTGRHVLLSTGAADRAEIEQALRWLDYWSDDYVTLLACDLVYPCPDDQANLSRITSLDWEFGLPVGYSDHTEWAYTALAAAALGAEVLEKHATLNPRGPTPDDKMGITAPEQLALYVEYAGRGAKLRGTPHLLPSPAEEPARQGARRAWHARIDLDGGTELRASHLEALRPCLPASVSAGQDVDGFRLLEPLRAGEALTAAHLGW